MAIGRLVKKIVGGNTKKKPKSMDPAERLRQRQAQIKAKKDKEKNVRGTLTAATAGVGAGAAGKAVKEKKEEKKAGISRNKYDTKKAGKSTLSKNIDRATKSEKDKKALLAKSRADMKGKPAKKKDAGLERNKYDTKKGKRYDVGVSKGGVPFKEAFAYYRKKGQKTFTWNGKKYTTEVKKGKK